MKQQFTTTRGTDLLLEGVRYLGDGVYAGFDTDRGMLVLCTYNGFEADNVVILEPEVQYALFNFLKPLEE